MPTKPLSRMALTLSLLLGSGLSLAHSGAHPIRYVSETGTDQGNCELARSPCRTIAYAVNHSSKGDKVHVAEGVYGVEGLDVFFLLSDMVEVSGGYSSNFKHKDTQQFNTLIKGIPAEYREKLQSRGFNLIQDTKGNQSSADFKLSLQDRALLDQYQAITRQTEGSATCVNGKAENYACQNIDLLSHMPLAEFSTNPSSANDIWGFTDLNDNKEYALIGLKNGTAVVDVTSPSQPKEIGTISGASSTWRDIKVYQCKEGDNYKAWAYVTTEASQGLQVIDLNNLPSSISLATTVGEFSSAHNVYLANVDYTTNAALENMQPYIYISGSNKNDGAYRVFSLTNPALPQLLTTPPAGTGYVHDATTLVIDDDRVSQCAEGHNPCELLVDFNETSVDIWDMTDKSAPFKISATPYSGAQYTHSGWWSADKNYIFIQDELDEMRLGLNTTLRTLDISNLTRPVVTHNWTGPTRAIDHNGFTKGNRYYMSNYRAGLTVLDVTNPNNLSQVGSFDTFAIPAENTANFNGAWGTYPYLPSGNILVSDIEYGLFVLKDNTQPNFSAPSSHVAACGSTDSGGGDTGGDDDGTGGDDTTPPPPEPVVANNSGGGSLGVIILLLSGLAGVRRSGRF